MALFCSEKEKGMEGLLMGVLRCCDIVSFTRILLVRLLLWTWTYH